MAKAHILGFPRIGKQRELKKGLEAFWRGQIDEAELLKLAKQRRQENWQAQADAGLDWVTVGDFSLYDHILDLSTLLGVIPERYQHSKGQAVSLATYFAMARGTQEVTALAMTKWFNTNYHYLVPELSLNQEFSLSSDKLFNEIVEAKALGYQIKPVLVGPISYLWLARAKDESFDKLELLPKLLEVYQQIFDKLEQLGISYLQLDEPILALDLDSKWQSAFISAYQQFNFKALKPILTTYFSDIGANLACIKKLPIAGIHIDICAAPRQLVKIANEWPKDKILSLGIVNGRNIWKNDLKSSLNILTELAAKFADNLWVASSCSLLHIPVDLTNEKKLNPSIKDWLAFAYQKLHEVVVLAKGVNYGAISISDEIDSSQQSLSRRQSSILVHDELVQSRINNLNPEFSKRKSEFALRIKAQQTQLQLPLLPTTTIGSFPQTASIRKIRQEFKSGQVDYLKYQNVIKDEIKTAISRQEELGIDVLVHGEAERNDMVEYFGEQLNGIAFSENGWVQSYGSRCVKPPLIYGDVSRSDAITVEWSKYAQSLTKKNVKGMLTGPVTILSWSFVRDDQALDKTALQIALALRDEVIDLEHAGIKIIQIDEPAFREALPLKKSDWQDYLNWAVYVFKIASSGVEDSTQIHTHMCYSSFNDIIQAIAALDADVITIETSRGDLGLLKAFENFAYPNQIGPGVYDIHSPRIPSSDEIEQQLEAMLKFIPYDKLWINPDCGLKTRDWPEVAAALQNMQVAAANLRERLNAHAN